MSRTSSCKQSHSHVPIMLWSTGKKFATICRRISTYSFGKHCQITLIYWDGKKLTPHFVFYAKRIIKRNYIHMLNNCPAVVRSGRYTWRHNSSLYTMCHYLSEFENVVFKLYADLFGFKSPIELFNRLITDNLLTINWLL